MLILEGTHNAEVKEQALCILANIGDGESAKEYIMANEDVLKKLTDYMVNSVTTIFILWLGFVNTTCVTFVYINSEYNVLPWFLQVQQSLQQNLDAPFPKFHAVNA